MLGWMHVCDGLMGCSVTMLFKAIYTGTVHATVLYEVWLWAVK